MNNIDFLPARYGDRRSARKSRLWVVGLIVTFGGVTVAVALGQAAMRFSVANELDAIVPKYARARTATHTFDRMQTQVDQLRASAQLYAYLRHPWPRTQILAAVCRPLPDEVTLTEIVLRPDWEDRRENGRRRRRLQSSSEEEQKQLANLHPAQRDLHRLRGQAEATKTVVELAGQMTDTEAFNDYIRQLGDSPLFEKVDIRSIGTPGGEARGASAFRVVLFLRAGYGQPGGPARPNQPVVNRTPNAEADAKS